MRKRAWKGLITAGAVMLAMAFTPVAASATDLDDSTESPEIVVQVQPDQDTTPQSPNENTTPAPPVAETEVAPPGDSRRGPGSRDGAGGQGRHEQQGRQAQQAGEAEAGLPLEPR